MSTATAIAELPRPDLKARRALLTQQLKQHVATHDSLTKRAFTEMSRIHAATYEWVTLALLDGARDKRDAVEKLAGTLKMASGAVSRWYYCGAFMAANKIAVDRCDARSVRLITTNLNMISTAERLKATDLIRKQAPHSEVAKVLSKSKMAAIYRAEHKATKLDKEGKLTKTRLRLEMRALKTLAQQFFQGREVAVQVLTDGAVAETV